MYRTNHFLMVLLAVVLVHGVSAQGGTSVADPTIQLQYRQGDAIRISVFPDTTLFLNGIYPVDEQGQIHLPLSGPFRIVNKTEEDLSEYLNTTYIQHLPYPNVQVQPLVRISFLGGFYRPGLYYVDPRVSLWDALQISGGPQREDGFKRLKWERNRHLVSANLVPDLESGRSLREMGFVSGDQITVTARPHQTAWETIRTDVLPVATLVTTTVLTSISIYQLIRN